MSPNTSPTIELFALSPAQKSLIVSSLLSPHLPVSITGGTADIQGEIDVHRFKKSIEQLIFRFDALQIAFFQIGENLHQAKSTKLEKVQLEFIDLSQKEDPFKDADDLIRKKLSIPFHLFDGTPPFRNILIKITDGLFRYHPYGHHALIDGWGFSLLLTFVLKNYNGENLDTQPPSYLKVIADKTFSDHKGEQAKIKALTYWKEKYQARPAKLFTPKFSDTLQAHVCSHQVLPSRYSTWLNLAETHGVSISSFLIAALLEELGRISGNLEPVIGTPVLNRSTKEQKETLGLFTHVIPLGIQLRADEPLLSLAARLGKIQRSDYRHSLVSIDDISRGWGTTLSSEEPIQVTVSFEKHDYNVNTADYRYSITAFSPLYQKRPLQIYVRQYQEDSPIQIDLYANNGYFSTESSQSLLTRWVARLDACTFEETIIPSPTPQHTLSPALPFNNLWDLLSHNVGLYGDHIAIEDESGAQLTYTELFVQAKKVRNLLKTQGIRPQDRVGLSCKRNNHLIVGLLGILGAGATYVPLDPDYPSERLRYLASDASLQVILADSDGQARCVAAEMDLPMIDLTSLDEVDLILDNSPAIDFNASQYAYIIYTSGSTGLPKGCTVSHANVLSLLGSLQTLHGYNSSDVWTMFHSYAFDFSVWEIWGALGFGGRLVIVSQNTSRDADYFYDLLVDKAITVLNQTPTAFKNLLHSEAFLKDHGVSTKKSLSLRRIIFGGEALDAEILKPWFERYGEVAHLINMYGITETTVHVTSKNIKPNNFSLSSLIGNPIPNWSIYILGPELQLLPKGVIGEIYVGGKGVSDGYWGRATLTAERFLPDPFTNNGQRMYRSGDLARTLENNEIEYLGRADQQVKIRGFRIELGEIQKELLKNPSIKDAIVLADKDRVSGDHRLIAWLVPSNNQSPPLENNIRGKLSEALPSYMIPAHFLVIDAIPLTMNGKLDTDLLKKVPLPFSNEHQNEVLANENEVIIGRIWQEILQTKEVFRADNFFSLGGDSIYALRFISQLKKAGLSLQLVQLYENPTLSDLATQCVPVKGEEILETTFTFKHAQDIEKVYPIAALQAGMMFHNQLDPESSVFLDVFNFKLTGAIDPLHLQQALHYLSAEIPALRTSFDWVNYPEPVQIIWQHAPLLLRFEDLSHLEKNVQEQQLSAFTYSTRKTPFDLEKCPLFRITLHQLSKVSFELTIAFHHSILDGWSFSMLMSRMLSDTLQAHRLHSPEPVKDVQAAYIAQERRAIQDLALQQFWREYLQDIPAIPTSNLKETSPKDATRTLFKISPEHTQNLLKIAKANGVSFKLTLLAVHLLAQSKIHRRPHVTTGYVVNCRPEIENSDLAIGLFLNTIVLKTTIPEIHDLQTWFLHLNQEEILLFSKRTLPLVEIQKLAKVNPLFDSAFNFVHFHSYKELLKNTTVTIDDFQVFEQTDFPFLAQFSIDPRNEHLELTLVTQEDLYPQENLEYYASQYLEAISLISHLPGRGQLTKIEQKKMSFQETPFATDIENTLIHAAPSINNEFTVLEKQLLEIWQNLLHRNHIEFNQSFFAMGGDSILATRMVMLVRKQFSVNLSLREFMSQPTLFELTKVISLLLISPHDSSKTPVPRAVRRKNSTPG